MSTKFHKLNTDWNADPNAPNPSIRLDGRDLILKFKPNRFQFPEYGQVSYIELTFAECVCYRIGPTNDEGWYRGQCRFSKLAPRWGEFYEVEGDLLLSGVPDAWTRLSATPSVAHHYLFYFRDETFECDAAAWQKRDIQ